MAGVGFADLQSRPTEFLDLTRLTLDALQLLGPPFEAAFQAHMAAWRLEGKPRTARQVRVEQKCPLPSPEDRLLLILAYLKPSALQVVPGRLFGMGQSKAKQGRHVFLPALRVALRALGDAPARSLTATVQNVLLVNALLMILFLSDTDGSRMHEKRIADATPSPIPARSRVLQDLGFLAFTLPQVAILIPTKKPRGEERTREQQWANQAFTQRRRRIGHGNSSGKRCRIVKERFRRWQEGVRDLVRELCCALHNLRMRLTP